MILPVAIAYAIWGGDSDTSDIDADPHPNEDGLNSINGEGDDLVEGGGGNDVIITGNGEDTVSGGEGTDFFDVTVGTESTEPVTITDLDFFRDGDGALPDRINFVNADGDLIPPEDVKLDNFQIVDADNGENVALFVSDSNTDALITYKGNQIIVLRNIVGGDIENQDDWVGNFQTNGSQPDVGASLQSFEAED